MRIAVTTPAGHVGSHVVRQLIRAGLRPRLLSRRPERLPEDLVDHVEVVACDQYEVDDVVAGTDGVDALYWVDPTTGAQDPLADYARATKAVVEAIHRNRIPRVVFQSSVGAEKRHGAGEIDGLAATEVALDNTDANTIHLRCGFFFTNLELQLDAVRAGVIPIILPLDQPLAWVAPRDIAEVAVGRLLNSNWSGHLVQGVHGPADLTWPQAAEIVAAAIGRPLRVERIDDEEMRHLLSASGMTDGLVDAVLGMSTGLRDGFVPEQLRTLTTTTPTTLDAWAYANLKPQLGL